MELREYLKTNNISICLFAKQIGVKNRTAVYRYFKGTKPSSRVMNRIMAITNGQVTPNDFYNVTSQP